jgi:hypothetical protein
MSVKINKHVFHNFYSKDYSPDFAASRSSKVLFADYPIHRNRAIIGATIDENNPIPKEFNSEEDAFKWYKKNKYKDNFKKLNFPEDFCKNYFIIPEEQFYKYQNYFHGMVKSFNIKFKYSTEFEASSENLNDCPCSSSSSSSSSGSRFLNRSLSLAILEMLNENMDEQIDLDNIFPEDSSVNTIELLQSNSQNCCYCPPCNLSDEEKSNYECKFQYKGKFTAEIECDSEKIFDIPDIEKRFGANSINRTFKYSYSDNDPNKKIEDTLSVGYRQYDPATWNNFSSIKLYKDNWKLNPDWKSNGLFTNIRDFSRNSTVINDPVIIHKNSSAVETPQFFIEIGLTRISNISSPLPVKESLEKQKEEQISNNLGKTRLKVDSENILFSNMFVNLSFYASTLIYIKSEKKFMCFFETDIDTRGDGVQFFHKRYKNKEDLSQVFPGFYQDINPLYLLTTDDKIKIEKNDENHFPCFVSAGEKMGLKLIKEKLNFKINNQNCEIEIYKPEKKEIFFKASKTEYSRTDCTNKSTTRNCEAFDLKKRWQFNNPEIVINSWQDSDFSDTNTFPPKVS